MAEQKIKKIKTKWNWLSLDWNQASSKSRKKNQQPTRAQRTDRKHHIMFHAIEIPMLLIHILNCL